MIQSLFSQLFLFQQSHDDHYRNIRSSSSSLQQLLITTIIVIFVLLFSCNHSCHATITPTTPTMNSGINNHNQHYNQHYQHYNIIQDGDEIIINSSNPMYPIDRLDWNQRIPYKNPILIIYCKTIECIQKWIKYVNVNSIPFRIRSGKHSYEYYSVVNDGIVIDVSLMNFIELHENKIKLGPGNRNFDIYNYLWKYGYAFPGGTCPTVGVSGFTAGGGFGYIARQYGLGIDNLLEMEIINHDSKLIKMNQTNEYSDLYWAMRGGGNGNFGVIVSLTFKLIKAPKKVIKYDLHWQGYDSIYEVFNTWQEFAPHTDHRLTSQFTIFNGSFASQGLFIDGQESELRIILSKLIASSPNNLKQCEFKTFTSYMDSVLEYAQCKSVDECLEIMHTLPSPNNPTLYKTKSSYAFKNVDRQAIDYFTQIIPQLELENSFICVQFDSYGGAIRQVSPNFTAFPHRHALFHAQYMIYYGERNQRTQVEQFINHLYDMTVPYLSPHAYVNYCDSYLKDYEFAYYSTNMFKLRELKKKYDPFNLFNYEQSIKLT